MSAKKKGNKAKKNSRANRKIETAKRIEAEKKAIVKVTAKPKTKVEETKPAPASEPIKKLSEAPRAKPMEVLTTAKIFVSAMAFQLIP